MEIGFKDQMYVGMATAFPLIMLFKGQHLFFVGLSLVLILLIIFDPIFKKLFRRVKSAKAYMINIYLTGFSVGVLSAIFENYHGFIIGAWWFYFLVLSLRLSNKIEKMKRN